MDKSIKYICIYIYSSGLNCRIDLFGVSVTQAWSNVHRAPGAFDLAKFRLVDMCMSCTQQVVKEVIIRAFTSETGLPIVAATVAFGMGIDFPSGHQVIHLGVSGVSGDLESYVQETGCLQYCLRSLLLVGILIRK